MLKRSLATGNRISELDLIHLSIYNIHDLVISAEGEEQHSTVEAMINKDDQIIFFPRV